MFYDSWVYEQLEVQPRQEGEEEFVEGRRRPRMEVTTVGIVHKQQAAVPRKFRGQSLPG